MRLRVLIAEDNEQMRRQLSLLLRREFSVIASVSDGKQLVDTALSLRPDVIVSDISMPAMTGPEAMAALYADAHKIPFVFVSASSRDVDDILDKGALGFVHKIDVGAELSIAVRMAASGRVYVSHNARLF